MMRLALVALVVACTPQPAARLGGARGPAPPCTPQFLGQLATTAIAVAANDRDVYWVDYDFGRLQHRALDGTRVTTLLPAREEQMISALVVAAPYLYWPSKGQQGVFRFPLAGDKPDLVIHTGEDGSEQLAFANGVLYATTFDRKLRWWRTDGKSGVRREPIEAVAATSGGAAYVRTERGLERVVTPDGALELVLAEPALGEFAVTRDAVFWQLSDGGSGTIVRRRRLSGGTPIDIAHLSGDAYSVFVPALNGAYLTLSNVVYFAPSEDAAVLRPVAYAPAAITDLAIARDGVVVGTDAGSVHLLCPDPDRAIELAKPASERLACGPGFKLSDYEYEERCVDETTGTWSGPSRTWYRSGHLKGRETGTGATRRSEEFYAGGTPRSLTIGEGDTATSKYYFVNGKLQAESVGEQSKTYDLDGTRLR